MVERTRPPGALAVPPRGAGGRSPRSARDLTAQGFAFLPQSNRDHARPIMGLFAHWKIPQSFGRRHDDIGSHDLVALVPSRDRKFDLPLISDRLNDASAGEPCNEVCGDSRRINRDDFDRADVDEVAS